MVDRLLDVTTKEPLWHLDLLRRHVVEVVGREGRYASFSSFWIALRTMQNTRSIKSTLVYIKGVAVVFS